MHKLFLTFAIAATVSQIQAAVYSDSATFLSSSTSLSLTADFEGLVDFEWGMVDPGNPYVVGPTLTITSNNDHRIYGTGFLGGGTNGLVTNGWTDTMTLHFADGTESVGFDYFVASTWGTGDFTIRAYGATDNLLYTSPNLNAPVRTDQEPGVAPAFFGLDGVGSIHRVEIGGSNISGVGVDNIYSVVPEPSAALLSLVGALGLLRRRRAR